MKHLLLLIGLAFLLPTFGLGQDPFIIQVSGLIVDAESLDSIPYARIQVNHTRRGALANEDGFYSIPVGLGDTLYFNHLGYREGRLIIRDYMREYQGDDPNYIYVVNYLYGDTVTLKEVVIFPYDTPEEIRTAVVNMDILEDSPEARARENLDPQTLDAIMASLPRDGNERLMVARQRYYNYYETKSLLPTASIDPIAAVRLLQYVVGKAKRQKNKDLNYWE
ncbi:MAG: hypothetical protein AAF135_08530 [Bacteroidota bacterium]